MAQLYNSVRTPDIVFNQTADMLKGSTTYSFPHVGKNM